MSLLSRLVALLGISAYSAPPSAGPSLDDPAVERVRRQYGGQLATQSIIQTRWYPDDIETASHAADTGDMMLAAQLMAAANCDGVLAGILSTRTGGLVRLPKRFRGRRDMVDALQAGGENARSVFEEMFPATELERLAADGVELGVGVGELVPVEGRAYPVFVRLDPQYLQYRWNENRWYYRSIAGLIAITPGDGRWVLHTPGGRMAPWRHALWKALGRAFVTKDHARERRDNWEAKLANAARVAVSPQGAPEEHKQKWFQKVMAWGLNTVFGVPPGYDVRLLESNGRGADSFRDTIKEQDGEYVIAIAGQSVTTDGGAGFANADIHKSIRADLIKATADGLAYTINTQGLPAFVLAMFGEEALSDVPTVEWDVTPPHDRKAEADALASVAKAIADLTAALAVHKLTVDAEALTTRFGIPVKPIVDAATTAAPAANDGPSLRIVRSAA